jgi:hypothetical protein
MGQKNNDKLKLNVKKVCNKIKEKMQEHFDFVCQDLFSGICTITFKPNNLTLKKLNDLSIEFETENDKIENTNHNIQITFIIKNKKYYIRSD